ncbi:MAG TPA: hypothetical protein VNK04_03445 [Gemmataceae bacterium]|jgi:hypothetical protein|nr:hypothetical protein [Gemmataceae bacterium]
MRIEFYGMVFETSLVTFHLWSPWRAAALEHRLFDAIRHLPRVGFEEAPDELRLHITDPKTWRAAVTAVARVLKGWQEEADPGSERRSWYWLIEGDTNADGYDHTGEPFTLWGFLRISLDRGGPGEPDKGEDIDLQGFGLRIWGETGGPAGRG